MTMLQQTDTIIYPSIRPVIHIENVEAVVRNPLADWVRHIDAAARKRGYWPSPDGWFVPLTDLEGDLPNLADYLNAAAEQSQEFEIGGGFEVLLAKGQSLGVPPGATFPLAMQLAQVAHGLVHVGDSGRVFVSSQDIWTLTYQENGIEIQVTKLAKVEPKTAMFPVRVIQRELDHARSEVLAFAGELRPVLLSRSNRYITSALIDHVFGIV